MKTAYPDLSPAIQRIEKALEQSRSCSVGLTGKKGVFGVDCGPSGGPEIFAVLYLDDPFFGFWYGHILQHPKRNVFVALILWSSKIINADRKHLLFKRLHFWTKERGEYQPCAVQSEGDAYAECSTLKSAAIELVRMIKKFDIDKRTAFEGSEYESSPAELRVLDVYALCPEHMHNEKCIFSSIPMPVELKLLKDSGKSS